MWLFLLNNIGFLYRVVWEEKCFGVLLVSEDGGSARYLLCSFHRPKFSVCLPAGLRVLKKSLS